MANARDDSTGRYAFLSSLDAGQLEKLLKTDYSGSMSEEASEEFIDAIIEVMVGKDKEEPLGCFTDVDKAWADFQTYYNVPERDGQLLYPDLVSSAPAPSQKERIRRPKRFLRRVSLIAATLFIFCATVVGAQASGIDVFGFLAQWTEDVFVYKPDSEYYPAIRDAFAEHHFPKELAPKWYPKGFEPAEPEYYEEKSSTSVNTLFRNVPENKRFSVLVRRYVSPERLLTLEHQRDSDSQQQYTGGGKTFLIVSNEGHTTATWSDQETLVMTISGDLPLKDVKKIIDSIGG